MGCGIVDYRGLGFKLQVMVFGLGIRLGLGFALEIGERGGGVLTNSFFFGASSVYQYKEERKV